MRGRIHQWLARDHERLDALLNAACPKGVSEGAIDLEAFGHFREGLLKHIGLEEKILLPMARVKNGGTPVPHAARLRADHGAIAALLVRAPTHESVAKLRALLEPHDELEEREGGVYDVCETLLEGSEDECIQRFEAAPDVPVAPYYEGPIRSRAHG